MVTLEDLKGSVQILCLNENYDKFAHLLFPRKPCSSPAKSTCPRQTENFPATNHSARRSAALSHETSPSATPNGPLTAGDLEAARELAASHPGKCPLFLCMKWPGGEIVFIEAHDQYLSNPRPFSASRRCPIRGRHLLRESRCHPAATRSPPMGKTKLGGNGEE